MPFDSDHSGNAVISKKRMHLSYAQHHWVLLQLDQTALKGPGIQLKIFLTKLKGHPNLFVIGRFLYSQYRNKEKKY